MAMTNCGLCPRNCGADRTVKTGICGEGREVRIAYYGRHMWEEPCIGMEEGSGTVFFSGCPLKCVYCQNYGVSRGKLGKKVSEWELASIFKELKDMGCRNIDLVTPGHFMPQVLSALDMAGELGLPVVFNSGGYENPRTLKMAEGHIDIYLPDFKYKSKELSERYSACADYYDRAMESLSEMLRQQPEAVYDSKGGLLKGVIIRHLVLPGGYKDSVEILTDIARNFGTKGFLLSLMSQYTPMPSCAAFPEINRRITTFEYKKAAAKAVELGFEGYFQDMSSSSSQYIPPFGQDGVKGE